MSSPNPQLDVIDLHNRLVETDPSDRPKLNQIEWRLRSLRRGGGRSDPLVAVTLLGVLIQQGKADDAHVLAAEQVRQAGAMPDAIFWMLFALLKELGHYEAALDLSTMREQPASDRWITAEILLSSAWGIGEIERLEMALAASQVLRPARARIVSQLLDRLSSEGLLASLPQHQAIVRRHTRQAQCRMMMSTVAEDDGIGSICTILFLEDGLANRIELEESIDGDLRTLYTEIGKRDAPYWEILPTVLMDVTGAPAFMSSSRLIIES